MSRLLLSRRPRFVPAAARGLEVSRFRALTRLDYCFWFRENRLFVISETRKSVNFSGLKSFFEDQKQLRDHLVWLTSLGLERSQFDNLFWFSGWQGDPPSPNSIVLAGIRKHSPTDHAFYQRNLREKPSHQNRDFRRFTGRPSINISFLCRASPWQAQIFSSRFSIGPRNRANNLFEAAFGEINRILSWLSAFISPSTSTFNSSLYSELIGERNLINSIKNARKGENYAFEGTEVVPFCFISFVSDISFYEHKKDTNRPWQRKSKIDFRSIEKPEKKCSKLCWPTKYRNLLRDCWETDTSITEDKKELLIDM